MNKSNVFKIMLNLNMAFLLSSCDKGVTYDQIIENTSDHDLKIYIFPDSSKGHDILYKKDSITIQRHSEISIAHFGGLGETSEYDDCDLYLDSVKSKVMDYDSLRLTLNISDKSNWRYTEIRKYTRAHGAVCECRLKITNDNIQ